MFKSIRNFDLWVVIFISSKTWFVLCDLLLRHLWLLPPPWASSATSWWQRKRLIEVKTGKNKRNGHDHNSCLFLRSFLYITMIFSLTLRRQSDKVWRREEKLWSLALFVCLGRPLLGFLRGRGDWIMKSWNEVQACLEYLVPLKTIHQSEHCLLLQLLSESHFG